MASGESSQVLSADDLDFRTRIINRINEGCARNCRDILLRLPRSAHGHAVMVPYQWSLEEAARYLDGTDRSSLPHDVSCLGDLKTVAWFVWIFDATDSRNSLSEVEIEPWQKLGEGGNDVVIFDMGAQNSFIIFPKDGNITRTATNKVSFSMNGHRRRYSLIPTRSEEMWPWPGLGDASTAVQECQGIGSHAPESEPLRREVDFYARVPLSEQTQGIRT
ncbi:hypothetical protein LTR49_005340 [Elasticomyces elasticus]|nr:hypothetical protein LTR49_005340 [Elasticomyces elasticus]